MRSILHTYVLHVTFIENFYAFRGRHFQLLREFFVTQSHQYLQELVANELAFRIYDFLGPVRERFSSDGIRRNESEIDIMERRYFPVHKVVALKH